MVAHSNGAAKRKRTSQDNTQIANPQKGEKNVVKKHSASVVAASPAKRLKPSTSDGKDTFKDSGSVTVIESKLKQIKEEERSFPRGGGSGLTPLEYKEISNQAAKDILFEANNSAVSKTKAKAKAVDADGDVDMLREGKKHRGGKPKFDSKKKVKKESSSKKEDTGPKIEGLSFRRLVPGTIVLGCISQINSTDIAVALPDNLTGYVPITSISDKLTKRIEAMIEDDSDSEEEVEKEEGAAEVKKEKQEKSESKEDDATNLSKYFSVGQYVRAYVTKCGETSTTAKSAAEHTKHRKHIELSLQPTLANSGVTKNELVVGCALQASVTSVEDHGLIMDLGLEDSSISGFISSNEIGQGMSLSDIQEGQVMLCKILGLSSTGKIIKLSGDVGKPVGAKAAKGGAGWKGGLWVSEAPTIDAFTPGTGVELLVTEVGQSGGLSGKIMGMVDGTVNFFHAGGWESTALEERVKEGNKINARVTFTCPGSDPKRLGLSILPHILSLKAPFNTASTSSIDPLVALPISTILNTVKVTKVEPKLGLFVDVGVSGIPGYIHISRISSEKKIEELSPSFGPYKLGSVHQARIIGFNRMDALYLCSMESKVLQQKFLRVEDISIGEVVKGKVQKLLPTGAILVELSEGITGYVEEMHLSDVKLKNLEKRFREGMEVKCRVLSVDTQRRRIRLTLKKTLVNSDAPIIKSYDDILPGIQTPGTLVSISNTGAVVSFYGRVTAYLPVHEMSEAYIHDPREHFRTGQSVQVHVVSVDPENERMRVSCKDPNSFGDSQKTALQELKPGQLVSGSIIEKSNDDLVVELQDVGATGLKGVLTVGHLGDNKKSATQAFRNMRAGQVLKDILILNKDEKRRLITLTLKPSMVNAAKEGLLLKNFEDVEEGKKVQGYVSNITMRGIFVAFAGGMVGFVNKLNVPADKASLPDFTMTRQQSITATISHVSYEDSRFYLTLNPYQPKQIDKLKVAASKKPVVDRPAVRPIDPSIKTIEEFIPGKLTKARITSVRETQINVQLADDVQGRIDVSQVFDNWEDIKNKKQPLQQFQSKQIIDVKIIGMHDARNHKFLAITHRSSSRKTPIFELSAKPSDVKSKEVKLATLDDMKKDSTYIAYVNNHASDCVWVNISPIIRGRVGLLDLSDDAGSVLEMDKNFPLGCALKCHILKIDPTNNRLDLSARSSVAITFESLSVGMIVPARVTKTTDRQVFVQLSEEVSGAIGLTDLVDDFSNATPISLNKGEIIRVCIIDINRANKRVSLSSRPSRVLSSSLSVKDPEILSYSDLKIGDIRRGFVKNVADQGIFVILGNNVKAFVPIRELSDSFIKEWKTGFKSDQLVKGKVLSVEPEINHVRMTLKESVVSGKVKPQITIGDLTVGQTVKGKVRSVAEFGVFVVVDNSANVSGLCHISEVADTMTKPEGLKKIYSAGDAVKAKILNIDLEKRRISFGLKASYFEDEESEAEEDNEGDSSSDEEGGGVILGHDALEDSSDDDREVKEEEYGDNGADGSDEDMEDAPPLSTGPGLQTNGFDWTGSTLDQLHDGTDQDSSDDHSDSKNKKKSKKRKQTKIKHDLTLDLATRTPQSVSDYERLLMGNPQSGELWVRYMAFQLQLSEVEKAREVAERALKQISTSTIEGMKEKESVWAAMLNLELEYGTEDSLEEVFKRACVYNDAQDMYEKLCNIYIQSGKIEKADSLFDSSIKKFSQSPKFWINYFTFLFTSVPTSSNPTSTLTTATTVPKARTLLPRALQSLPTNPPQIHKHLILKFALLEFTPEGSPERGRTLLENLIETYGSKSRAEIVNVWVDAEIKLYTTNLTPAEVSKENIRALLRRNLSPSGGEDKGNKLRIKPHAAKSLFKKWLSWEEKIAVGSDTKGMDEVRRLARGYTEWVAESKKVKSEADEADEE